MIERGTWAAMKVVLMLLVRTYQGLVSPLLPPACRFQPSCSHYALTALERFGAMGGTWLALRRISRCHPFHPGGYDPVPEVFPTLGKSRLEQFISTAESAPGGEPPLPDPPRGSGSGGPGEPDRH